MDTGHNLKRRKAGRPLQFMVSALVTLGALGQAGCKEGRFTPDAKFVDLYVELKLATVVFANDLEKVNETRRVILAQHGFTPSDFHDRYQRLMEHPEAWRNFQEQVIAKVEEYQDSRKGDTANGI
jgi:hypothetical protein